MGHFLKEKLGLDQLTVDLYSGTGTAKDILLDVAVSAVNYFFHLFSRQNCFQLI